MLALLIPAAIVGTVLVSRKARAKSTDNDGVSDRDRPANTPDLPEPFASGRVDVRELALAAGAPSIWADFFAMTAYGESKLNTDVALGIRTGAPAWIQVNDSKSEAAAACKVYKKNIAWLKPCWPAAGYCFGSGGLFGMLPAAGIAAFKDDPAYRCVHPWSIFDPSAAIIYAEWFARRLQGWPNWTGTVLSMRAGWGNPSGMGKNPAAEKREKWAGHCQSVGLPPSFLDQQLPRWKPDPARETWAELGVDNGWLPEESRQVA